MDENVSLIMMCFQGPLVLCCTSVIQMLYFSQFFSCFFIGLHKIVYVQMYSISNIDICSLLVRIIDCVTMKPE